jgi:hypothetical protein
MLLIFQKCHYFFHGLMKLIRRGRGSQKNDGVLVVVTRRVTIDDNPAASGTRPILNLQTLWNKWSGINSKVRHLRLRRSFLGRRIAEERRNFQGGRHWAEVGVFWSWRIWGRNTLLLVP